MTPDRLLLDALAHLVDHLDPAPDDLAARAADALAERVDAVPLRLLTDSALVTPPGTRGRCATRTLRFAGLDLQLDHADGGLHATGLAPRPCALATARWPGGEVRAAVDRTGWFHLDGVPFGPVRFVLDGPAGRRATPWFVA
ncbi:hypothetical protein [Saccharothrix syringae]|uniref:Carboxypeptidase regulatory-like domain-containing protein n=1 Tax=Saccharothrix syringae TaxID=103733 RepID=A0A5Q0HBM5_SACSY|nr:hypothetical protein [Saccharothrix syringae]QFZ23636.1 hypothetical protein EKG83_44910 [Saccharothrix syringae]